VLERPLPSNVSSKLRVEWHVLLYRAMLILACLEVLGCVAVKNIEN